MLVTVPCLSRIKNRKVYLFEHSLRRNSIGGVIMKFDPDWEDDDMYDDTDDDDSDDW